MVSEHQAAPGKESAMIKRLYIDNYRCMVNFEYMSGQLQLLYGANGTGKTTVFQALETLKEFVVWGRPTSEMFPPASLTKWEKRNTQKFELELLDVQQDTFKYVLEIEHQLVQNKSRIKRETLLYNNKPLYEFDGEDSHLYQDDHSPGPTFPMDWSRSALTTIPERSDNTRLVWFRNRLADVHYLTIDPNRIVDFTVEEHKAPNMTLDNFPSWYRHLTQDSPDRIGELFKSLEQVIEGYKNMRLSSAGEGARVLWVKFGPNRASGKGEREYDLRFNELSTGQKCLVVLFTILHCAVREQVTLCIDEPDNYVALREIQPWVNQLHDHIEDERGQCLIISHHPELIDHLAIENGVEFYRDEMGPVRTRSFIRSQAENLRPSEVIARGWEGEG
jgi:predicted ATPase